MQQDVGGKSENPLLICRSLYKTETSYLFVARIRNICNNGPSKYNKEEPGFGVSLPGLGSDSLAP